MQNASIIQVLEHAKYKPAYVSKLVKSFALLSVYDIESFNRTKQIHMQQVARIPSTTLKRIKQSINELTQENSNIDISTLSISEFINLVTTKPSKRKRLTRALEVSGKSLKELSNCTPRKLTMFDGISERSAEILVETFQTIKSGKIPIAEFSQPLRSPTALTSEELDNVVQQETHQLKKFTSLNELISHINEFSDDRKHEILESLHGVGIDHVLPLLMFDEQDLYDRIKRYNADIKILHNFVRDYFRPDLQSLSHALDQENSYEYLYSGSIEFDTMFVYSNGQRGLRTNQIVEVVGDPGTGKTQLLYTLCARTLAPKKRGGLGREAVFIHTRNKFSASRFKEIAEYWGGDTSRISISYARDLENLQMIFEKLILTIGDRDIGIIAIDDLTDLFPFDFDVRSRLDQIFQRENRIYQVFRVLQQLASLKNCLVLYSNRINGITFRQTSYNSYSYSSEEEPDGGLAMAYSTSIRVHLKRISLRHNRFAPSTFNTSNSTCRLIKAKLLESGLTQELSRGGEGYFLIGYWGIIQPSKEALEAQEKDEKFTAIGEKMVTQDQIVQAKLAYSKMMQQDYIFNR